MTAPPYLLAIIGQSGSGKTTLIVKLIDELKKNGLAVGAVKRSHHHIELDKEGKDSWRFRNAGSNPTVIACDDFVGVMESTREPVEISGIARWFDGKADIVLIEGFKKEGSIAKLVFDSFVRDDRDDTGLIGFITENGAPDDAGGKPSFHRDDAPQIAKCIIERMKVAENDGI